MLPFRHPSLDKTQQVPPLIISTGRSRFLAQIKVTYVGKLEDGTIFDQNSSVKHALCFKVGSNQVIRCVGHNSLPALLSLAAESRRACSACGHVRARESLRPQRWAGAGMRGCLRLQLGRRRLLPSSQSGATATKGTPRPGSQRTLWSRPRPLRSSIHPDCHLSPAL